MTGRTLILMIMAIVAAIVVVMVVKGRSHTTQQAGTKILVATMDIPAGSFVRADKQLAWIDWPQANVSPAFITQEAHKVEEFNGGIAHNTIQADEPITMKSIVRSNEGGFMSAVLTPGKRAVSIAVNLTSGNAGFVFPGDKVDLILTHRVGGKTASGDLLASETFIQDVRVLAVDQMLDNPDKKAVMAKTITLEVSPKEAEMINVASSLGSISVSLRSLASNPDAAATPKVSPAGADEGYSTNDDVSKLMGDKSDVHAKVSVYHGGTPEQLDFHQGQK